ncbi:MAG: hypothetical protein KC503_28110 [Myxococcales bacterium]|nr:hypothetical protein [Myxococcales bacterium]
MTLIIGALVGVSACATTSASSRGRARSAPAAFGAFYPHLERHGRFFVHHHLGWVFKPNHQRVGDDFFPYASHGRFVATSLGWAFVSDLPFGWITFHYGRWSHDDKAGWIWLPGPHWAPAWVGWREGPGVVAWAPLPPRAPASARALRHLAPWVASARAALGVPLSPPMLLHGPALARALRGAAIIGDKVASDRVRWYRGPALPAHKHQLVAPQPSTLARLEQKGELLTLTPLGPLVIKPRAVKPRSHSRLRVSPWSEHRPIFPVMPGVDAY